MSVQGHEPIDWHRITFARARVLRDLLAMSRMILLVLTVFAVSVQTSLGLARSQQDCPKPIVEGIEDFVWPGGSNLGPPCVVVVTASGREKLYTLTPAPPGLQQRAVERDDRNDTVGVAFVSDSGEPLVTVGLSKRYPLPTPVAVAGGSQVSAAHFLPRPGIVISLTNERVAQWHEDSGLYTLIVQRRYSSASLEEIASSLSVLNLEAPGTGSGLEPDGGGPPFFSPAVVLLVFGSLILLAGTLVASSRSRCGGVKRPGGARER